MEASNSQDVDVSLPPPFPQLPSLQAKVLDDPDKALGSPAQTQASLPPTLPQPPCPQAKVPETTNLATGIDPDKAPGSPAQTHHPTPRGADPEASLPPTLPQPPSPQAKVPETTNVATGIDPDKAPGSPSSDLASHPELDMEADKLGSPASVGSYTNSDFIRDCGEVPWNLWSPNSKATKSACRPLVSRYPSSPKDPVQDQDKTSAPSLPPAAHPPVQDEDKTIAPPLPPAHPPVHPPVQDEDETNAPPLPPPAHPPTNASPLPPLAHPPHSHCYPGSRATQTLLDDDNGPEPEPGSDRPAAASWFTQVRDDQLKEFETREGLSRNRGDAAFDIVLPDQEKPLKVYDSAPRHN